MRYLYTICLLLFLFNGFAQQPTIIIKGRVLGADSIALRNATVVALNERDQQLLQTLSDSSGNFTLALNILPAQIRINHNGYIPYSLTDVNRTLLTIKLKADNKQLNEVTIRSEKPFLEQRFDRMIVNVDGDTKAGISAADILKKIPGVMLLDGTNLSLEGKSVTIYMDGKPTRMNGNDLMALLNNTSSTSISRMEVVYSPSAKYDASNNGGVIDIVTRKRTQTGYDANVSLTAGHGWKYFSGNGVSAGLNYRSGNNYLYGSYSYQIGAQSQEIIRNTYFNDINQRLRDSLVYHTPYHSQNIRLGWDHYLNKTDVLGVLVTAYNNYNDPNMNTYTGIFRLTNANADSTRFSEDNNPRTSLGANLNLNYKVVLDSLKKKELTMDGDAGLFDNHNNNILNSVLKNEQGAVLFPAQLIAQTGGTRTHIYSYKADYSQRWLKGTFETGAKASYVDIDNQFISNSTYIGSATVDDGSNDFRYRETILAGYLSSKQVFGKWTLQAGLRAEQTSTNGHSVTLDSLVKRSYFNLFPNFIAAYKLKSGQVSLSYSRSIGRPTYSYLNPFTIVRSTYSVNAGNPYLLPSFTNNLRAAFSWHEFSFSGTYSYTSNVITDLQTVNDITKVTTSLKANLSTYHNTGVNIAWNKKVFGVLSANYSAGTSFSSYNFNYQQQIVGVSQLTAFTILDNQFQLPHSWWVDVYFYAQSRVTYGNQVNLPFSTTSLSGGKKLWNGKGDLSISINDIFFTNITRSETHYANVNYDVYSKYDSRSIRASLSYRFGSSAVTIRKRNSGSADEQSRNR